jgi:hypothetical protein
MRPLTGVWLKRLLARMIVRATRRPLAALRVDIEIRRKAGEFGAVASPGSRGRKSPNVT